MQNEKKAICTMDEVEKHYGRALRALGPVSLGVFPGEALGVRGRNGAGKSTLLQLLAGVISPDSGSVVQDERIKGRVGYLPQEIALYETLSCLDNLRFWGRVYGMGEDVIKVRSRWLLNELGLWDKAKSPVHACSGGMRRRLHLATALMPTPLLLLLDEPTVGADDPSAELILAMLERMSSNGCGVVFISHRQGELERVCRRIITLDGGLITDRWEGRL